MKNVNRWVIPLLVGVFLVVTEWIIEDGELSFWKKDDFMGRIYALILVIICAYLIHFFITEIMLRYFTKKNEKKINAKEYLFVVSVYVIILTVLVSYVSIFINHRPLTDEKTLANFIGVYGLGVPLLLAIYLVMRANKISEAYNRQTLQLEKTRSNQLETELKYLRAQYHPHFLFNALNTVYFRIDRQNTDAKNTVELLSELLRYQLYNINEKVNISEELSFIKSYIQFQQLRMTKRLQINTYFDENLKEQKIYPLDYQPFIENALKYVSGEYWIHLEIKLVGNQIVFKLENSTAEQIQQKKSGGIGIENIKRRLALLYPERHFLNVKQNEKSFVVELIINPKLNED